MHCIGRTRVRATPYAHPVLGLFLGGFPLTVVCWLSREAVMTWLAGQWPDLAAHPPLAGINDTTIALSTPVLLFLLPSGVRGEGGRPKAIRGRVPRAVFIYNARMQKTFDLTHPKLNRERRVEAVKNEIRKYIKRERRRDLPSGVNFWDFSCTIGVDEGAAMPVHVDDINKQIDAIVRAEADSFYLSIHARPGVRKPKPKAEETTPEEG